MTHAASWRRGLPGDESDYRLLHIVPDVSRRGFFGIAADLTDHDDGVRIRIGIEDADRVDESGADNRIAADADTSGLPDAEAGQLTDSLVRQSARSRYDAHVALAMDMRRHNSDLALAR